MPVLHLCHITLCVRSQTAASSADCLVPTHTNTHYTASQTRGTPPHHTHLARDLVLHHLLQLLLLPPLQHLQTLPLFLHHGAAAAWVGAAVVAAQHRARVRGGLPVLIDEVLALLDKQPQPLL